MRAPKPGNRALAQRIGHAMPSKGILEVEGSGDRQRSIRRIGKVASCRPADRRREEQVDAIGVARQDDADNVRLQAPTTFPRLGKAGRSGVRRQGLLQCSRDSLLIAKRGKQCEQRGGIGKLDESRRTDDLYWRRLTAIDVQVDGDFAPGKQVGETGRLRSLQSNVFCLRFGGTVSKSTCQRAADQQGRCPNASHSLRSFPPKRDRYQFGATVTRNDPE